MPDSAFRFGRLSQNIEDRRDDSMLQNYGGGIIAALRESLRPDLSLQDMKLMLANPLTPWRETLAKQPPPAMPITPLGVQAGMLDIAPGHQAWLAQRAQGGQ